MTENPSTSHNLHKKHYLYIFIKKLPSSIESREVFSLQGSVFPFSFFIKEIGQKGSQ